MPQLPDGSGNAALVAHIARHTRIPPFCGRWPETSRVVVEFTITATGDISNAHIIRSVDERVDAAVLAAISSMPCWELGRQRGLAVPTKFTLPVSFHWR